MTVVGGPRTRVLSLTSMTLLSPLRATLARTFKQLFPGRFAVAGIVVVTYLAVSLLTRVGLAIFNGEATEFVPVARRGVAADRIRL